MLSGTAGHIDIRELFLQLAKGDHSAFTDLFYYYTPRLYPFILKKVKHPSTAEELVQDIFLKLWTKRKLIGETQNPEGYLYRIASNRVLDYFKRLAVEQRLIERQMTPGVPKKDTTIADDLQRKEIEVLVDQAVKELPAQRKKIYRMREQGLSYSEIAKKLNLSTNTVKNQLIASSKFVREYLLRKGISPLLFIQCCLLLKKVFVE